MDGVVFIFEDVDEARFADPVCAEIVFAVAIDLAARFLLEEFESAFRTFPFEDVLPFESFHVLLGYASG